MNDLVREWISKAEGDFGTAGRELAAAEGNPDAVCYHAQQCIEKLLKAGLLACGCLPPKVHDLVRLDALLREARPLWDADDEDLDRLSQAAVIFRYPGETRPRGRRTRNGCVRSPAHPSAGAPRGRCGVNCGTGVKRCPRTDDRPPAYARSITSSILKRCSAYTA